MKQKICYGVLLTLSAACAAMMISDFTDALFVMYENERLNAMRIFILFCRRIPYLALVMVSYSNLQLKKRFMSGMPVVVMLQALRFAIRTPNIYAFGLSGEITPTKTTLCTWGVCAALLLVYLCTIKRKQRIWRIAGIILSAALAAGAGSSVFWNKYLAENISINVFADALFMLCIATAMIMDAAVRTHEKNTIEKAL